MIVGAFVIWCICAVASAMIADRKGINGCAAGAVGFALGPIGVIIVAVTPPSARVMVRNAKVASQAEVGAQKLCPHCRSYVPAAAAVCRFCQREVPDVAPSAIAARPSRKCAHIWMPRPDGASQCINCFLVAR